MTVERPSVLFVLSRTVQIVANIFPLLKSADKAGPERQPANMKSAACLSPLNRPSQES